MKKAFIIALLIVILIFLSIPVIAPPREEGVVGGEDEKDAEVASTEEKIDSGQNVEAELDKLAQSGKIKDIDPQKIPNIQPASAIQKHWGSLTEAQQEAVEASQAIEDNFGIANRAGETNLGDLSDSTKNEVLSSASAKPVVQVGDTKARVFQGGFELEQSQKLDVGKELVIRDGEGISFNPPNLTVKKANSIEFLGISNEKVEDFRGNTEKRTYKVGKANAVQAGCFNVRDIRNANFTLNSKIDMTIEENGSARVIFGFRNEFEFQATGKDNVISADPRECFNPNFQVRNANLSFPNADFEEIIQAVNQTNLTVSQDYGLECIQFTPIGSYTYKHEKIERTFQLKAEKEEHKICFRKYSDQTYQTNQPRFTVVDFIAKKIMSNGMISYKRFFYNYYANPILLIAPNLRNHQFPESDFSSIMRLNADFNVVTENEVFNDAVKNRVTFSNFVSVQDRNGNRYWEIHPEITEVAEININKYKTISFPEVEVFQKITKSNNVQVIPPDHPVFQTDFFIFKEEVHG